MSNFPSYPTRSFSETQKFFVLDPQTGTPSFVLGSDLVNFLTPGTSFVFSESTRVSAQASNYKVGNLIQTAGAVTEGDGLASGFLVVPGGEGDFAMQNGNDLLVIRGDDLLREQLKEGVVRMPDLVAMESTPGRFDGDAARLVSGTGIDGPFRWNSSDLSATLVLASATSDSVDDTTDTINDADHPFSDGDGVITQTTVNGLTAQTVYWVVNSTSGSYQLSATFDGGAVDLTGTTNITIDHLLDPRQGIWVTPSSDKTGGSGAWVRRYGQAVMMIPEIQAAWFDLSLLDTRPPIHAAMSLIKEIGGNDIRIPSGTFDFSGVLRVPDGVNLLGTGGGSEGTDISLGTSLRAIDSSSQVVFGNGFSGGRGGVTSGIVFDGNGTGATPFVHLNLSVQRTYQDISIVDCGSDGLWLDKSQNNTFISLFVSRNLGNGLVLDNGAGGNNFYRAEIAKSGGFGVLIQESTGTGPYPRPTHNTFWGSIIERGHDSTGVTSGMLRATEGDGNDFINCVLSVTSDYTISGSDAVVQAEAGTTHLQNCRINGGTVHSLIRQEPGAGLYLKNVNKLLNSPTAFIYNGGFGSIDTIEPAGVTTIWGGTGDLGLLFHEISQSPQFTAEPGATRLARFRVEGDSRFRVQVTDKGFEFSDGSNNPDTSLFRHSAGVLRSDGKIVAAGGIGGASIFGAPAGAQFRKVPFYDAAGAYVGMLAMYDDPEP